MEAVDFLLQMALILTWPWVSENFVMALEGPCGAKLWTLEDDRAGNIGKVREHVMERECSAASTFPLFPSYAFPIT